jgi:hypothetical protein
MKTTPSSSPALLPFPSTSAGNPGKQNPKCRQICYKTVGFWSPHNIQTMFLFKQINLQKSKIATANFGNCLVNWSRCSLFSLLQEPATTTKGRTKALPRGTQHRRAAILAKTDPTPGNELSPEIIITSVNPVINKNAISDVLTNIVRYGESLRLPYIMGIDTNSYPPSTTPGGLGSGEKVAPLGAAPVDPRHGTAAAAASTDLLVGAAGSTSSSTAEEWAFLLPLKIKDWAAMAQQRNTPLTAVLIGRKIR